MILFEMNRSKLISTIKDQTPSRYSNRLKVQILKGTSIDPDLLARSGSLHVKVPIQGESGQYYVNLEIDDYLQDLQYVVDNSSDPNFRSVILQTLRYALLMYDMKIYCSCPDFHYRFEYVANQKGVLLAPPGDKDIEPADQTNPSNEGVACKHISFVLANHSRWTPRVVTLLGRFIRSNNSRLGR
ncbi:tail protein [Listeria phage LIS04]|nr:tail protein [Listeria phage LIS04]